jgi:NAD(P)-dependent dehydrogenase (short-subunit alcohol dehydrogenase family)
MTKQLSQPAALVTGASRGIGRGISLKLAADGLAVAVNYATNQEAADAVVTEISAAGRTAFAVQGDVGLDADRRRMLRETLDRFGRLDVLVNNAGVTSLGRKDLLEAEEASWDRVLATNLKGPFFLSQLAAREMIGQIKSGVIPGGKIVNVTSISAYAVSTDRADYCISKAGLRMATQLFAARLAEEGITVFEVCPGIVESDMTAPVREKYQRRIAEGMSPLRRWGTPDDVAAAVSAIVAGALPFSTGECLNVDGGFHLRRL